MAALPALITVERFRQLTDSEGQYVHELHHGEVVRTTRPKLKQYRVQFRLSRLLESGLGSLVHFGVELPYRAVAEFDLRAADVAVVLAARFEAADREDYLHGAPEIVIEVKSPSNRLSDLRQLASMCLGNGSLEFWVVDVDTRSVTVFNRAGDASLYKDGNSIPLTLTGSGVLVVSAIFA